MKIYIVGIGMGNKDIMTKKALDIVYNADCIIGATRMVECFLDANCEKFISLSNSQITEYIRANQQFNNVVIVVSGDVGFFSATKKLLQLLDGFDVELVCGISSVVYFCSTIKEAWDDLKIISVHGRTANFLGSVTQNRKTFILTGGKNKACDIINSLCENGFENAVIFVGENLSYENEKITKGIARDLLNKSFNDLSVMLIINENFMQREYVTHGIADEEFIRADVPMTKCEVRSVSLSKLRVNKNHIAYDIGAGTGSVAIEIALQATDGFVYAIEKNEKAIELIKNNRDKFGIKNLEIINAVAPCAISDLPSPDIVFIGGSSGNMDSIVESVLSKNPKARIVVNAITLETVSEAVSSFNKYKLADVDIVQMSVSKSKKVGTYNMMMGQNPVFIISGQGV